MPENPKDLKYTKEHEWARRTGSTVIVGVTAYAQESLGDVVYVELPRVGASVTQGQSFGVIESTKAVSELYAPLSGKVVKINEELNDSPQTVNQDPYGAGWLIEVEPSDPKQLDTLLDAEGYEKVVAAAK